MKIISLICLVLIFGESFGLLKQGLPQPKAPLRSGNPYDEGYFTQKLDHFNESDETTWNQRYYVNPELFTNDSSNVAFLLLGGKDEADEIWMVYGSWIQTAQKYEALLFQLEHRFYGKSQPFSDLSTENLHYLSSKQALADAANFIKGMNEEYSLGADVKWIVFGSAYAGSLAVWMRLKYPELVHGAKASSAPLQANFNFSEYFQVVLDDIEGSNKHCIESLRTAMEQVDDLLVNPTENRTLTNIFNLCEPIEGLDVNSYKVTTFYNRIADAFAVAAQYNGYGKFSIDDMCATLTNNSYGDEIYRLYEATKLIYGVSCFGYDYDKDVEYLRDIYSDGYYRQWYYQTCTEFGWYQTTKTEDNVWGRGCNVDFYTNLCSEVFGSAFNETFIKSQIDKTNAYYGGIDIDVSNVVYVHGSLDPWHAVGLTETTNPESPVIYIEGASQSADIYAFDDDPPELTAAKKEIDRLIGMWLGFN